jgi:hypothetical protein
MTPKVTEPAVACRCFGYVRCLVNSSTWDTELTIASFLCNRLMCQCTLPPMYKLLHRSAFLCNTLCSSKKADVGICRPAMHIIATNKCGGFVNDGIYSRGRIVCWSTNVYLRCQHRTSSDAYTIYFGIRSEYNMMPFSRKQNNATI